MSPPATAPPASGSPVKKKYHSAYQLFMKAVRVDMNRKFGGPHVLAAHFAKHHHREEGEETLSYSAVKMAVLGNMWTDAVPSVRAFFEDAAQRQAKCDEAEALEADSKGAASFSNAENESELDDEGDRIGAKRAKPAGGGKSQKSKQLSKDAPAASTDTNAAGSKASKLHPSADTDTPGSKTSRRTASARRAASAGKELDAGVGAELQQNKKKKGNTLARQSSTEAMFEDGEEGLPRNADSESTPLSLPEDGGKVPRSEASASASDTTEVQSAAKVDGTEGGKRATKGSNPEKRKSKEGKAAAAEEARTGGEGGTGGASSSSSSSSLGGKGVPMGRDASGKEGADSNKKGGKEKRKAENLDASATGKGDASRSRKAVEAVKRESGNGDDGGRVGSEKRKDTGGKSGEKGKNGVDKGRDADKGKDKDTGKPKGSKEKAAGDKSGSAGASKVKADADKEASAGGAREEGSKSGKRRDKDGDNSATAKGEGANADGKDRGKKRKSRSSSDNDASKDAVIAGGSKKKSGSSEGGEGDAKRTSTGEKPGGGGGGGRGGGSSADGARTAEASKSGGGGKGDRGKKAVNTPDTASEGEEASSSSSRKRAKKAKEASASREAIKAKDAATPKKSSSSSSSSKEAGKSGGSGSGREPGRGSSSRPEAGKSKGTARTDSASKDSQRASQKGRGKREQREKDTPSTSSSSQSAGKGRRAEKEKELTVVTEDDEDDDDPSLFFGLPVGKKSWVEVEWEVEVQKSGRKPEETVEWFTACVDLSKRLSTDKEGQPKWRINYSRRGSLPASKSKVVFLNKTELVDDYQDDPLLWRKKGSELKASVLAISPKRPGSAGGSVASSVDQEVEWREDFGLKSRRR